MPLKPDLVDELNVLMQFSLSSTQQGIKVHHTADPTVIAATKRLFDKGLVTQTDGGYLTEMGRQAVEHTKAALNLLNPH